MHRIAAAFMEAAYARFVLRCSSAWGRDTTWSTAPWSVMRL